MPPRFESTLPAGEPELGRASGFERYLERSARRAPEGALATRLSSLSPSLMLDLLRFEQRGRGADLLEVAAASVRHARALTVHLRLGDRALPLTIFPREHLAHCALDLSARLGGAGAGASDLEVLQVEPAMLRPPGHDDAERVGDAQFYRPLPALLWALAIHGRRAELLAEVGGAAVYRVSPGFELARVAASGALGSAVQRLRREVASLREIAGWPGLDRERAARLVNALYLQAGLIVSRSHPAALAETWPGIGP